MRLVDMQVSVNATVPGGDQYGQLQSAVVYRFFHDIEQARKTNLQRQESTIPVQLTYAPLTLQDQKTTVTYTNRVKRESDHSKEEDSDSKTEYGSMSKSDYHQPLYIDFSA